MKSRSILLLIASILVAQTAGIIGSFFTLEAVETWYTTLARPLLSPPNWIFGPVWTTLYTLMGIAAWRIYERRASNPHAVRLLWVYAAHLGVNTLWSIAFFGWQNPPLALGIIAVLWGMIAYLILRFYRIDRIASYLLIPYLAWVTFATYLNASFAVLN